MPKRSPTRGAKKSDYAVGYARPPQHSRFQKGQSGNPSGRRQGVRNFATEVMSTLNTPVTVDDGDRLRIMSVQAATMATLRDKALGGDPRALDRLIDLASRYNNQQAETDAPVLDDDDEKIIAAFEAAVKAPCEPAMRAAVEAEIKARLEAEAKATVSAKTKVNDAAEIAPHVATSLKATVPTEIKGAADSSGNVPAAAPTQERRRLSPNNKKSFQ